MVHMVHKSQAGTAALRLTVLSLQAKSVSAFLGELASGKLTSPGSVLHETLRWYQLGIHTLQGQVQTLQSAPSAQRLNELQRLLEQAQHESADLRKRLSAAEAQVRMQSYRISAAQNALAVYRSSNKKNILQTVRLGDRLCAFKQKTLDAKRGVRNRDKKVGLRTPVPSFQSILLGALKSHPEETMHTVQGGAEALSSTSPPWVLAALRKEHKKLWARYEEDLLRLTGWQAGRQGHGQGGAVCQAFGLFGDTKIDNKGCWDATSLITAILRSDSGRSAGGTMHLRKSFCRAAKVLNRNVLDVTRRVAIASISSGGTARQASAIVKAAGVKGCCRSSLDKVTKGLKKQVNDLMETAPTGTDGCGTNVFRSLEISLEMHMVHRSQVVMHALHSVYMVRRGVLILSAALVLALGTVHTSVVDDVNKHELALSHVRLAPTARSALAAAAQFNDRLWVHGGHWLSMPVAPVAGAPSGPTVESTLQHLCPQVPHFLVTTVVHAYALEQSQYMVLNQVEQLCAELLVFAATPAFQRLFDFVPASGGINYHSVFPEEQPQPEASDIAIEDALCSMTSTAAGLVSWPPSCTTMQGAIPEHVRAWAQSPIRSEPVSTSGIHLSANATFQRMLSSASCAVMRRLWDGAKTSRGGVKVDILQHNVALTYNAVQVPLFNKEQKEEYARRLSKSKVPRVTAVLSSTSANFRHDAPVVADGLSRLANVSQAQLPKRTMPKPPRNGFAKLMSAVSSMSPCAVSCCKETQKKVQEHVIDPHENDVKNAGSLHSSSTIAPGLHFHWTDVGLTAKAGGLSFHPSWITCFRGRERTLAGETPLLVIKCTRLLCTDMKGFWDYSAQGGKSDALHLRCAFCVDKHCMQEHESHKAMLSTLHVFPQETLREFAKRARMFLWDVLRFNWSLIRNDEAINPFTSEDFVSNTQLQIARQALDSHASNCSWWTQADALLRQPGGCEIFPDALKREVERSLSGLILDTREKSSPLGFYTSFSHVAASSNPAWRPPRCDQEDMQSQVMLMALVIVGKDSEPRMISVLRYLNVAMVAYPVCSLHARLRIVPALLKSAWKEAHGFPEAPGSHENSKRACDQVNAVIKKGNFEHQLTWGELQVTCTKTWEKKSGCPSPSGPATSWALENMVIMMEAAFRNCPPTKYALGQRFITLAKTLESLIDDLERVDWSPILGTEWSFIEEGDLAETWEGRRPLNGAQISDPILVRALHLSPSRVSRRILDKLDVHENSFVVCSDQGVERCMRPKVGAHDHDDWSRQHLPERFKQFCQQWMAVHDRTGRGCGWGMFYLHEFSHHLGARCEWVASLGFPGHGHVGQGVLEKCHQV